VRHGLFCPYWSYTGPTPATIQEKKTAEFRSCWTPHPLTQWQKMPRKLGLNLKEQRKWRRLNRWAGPEFCPLNDLHSVEKGWGGGALSQELSVGQTQPTFRAKFCGRYSPIWWTTGNIWCSGNRQWQILKPRDSWWSERLIIFSSSSCACNGSAPPLCQVLTLNHCWPVIERTSGYQHGYNKGGINNYLPHDYWFLFFFKRWGRVKNLAAYPVSK